MRALHPPFPGATLELAGRRVLLGAVEQGPAGIERRRPGSFELMGGLVLLHTGDEPLVITRWFDGNRNLPGALLADALVEAQT